MFDPQRAKQPAAPCLILAGVGRAAAGCYVACKSATTA